VVSVLVVSVLVVSVLMVSAQVVAAPLTSSSSSAATVLPPTGATTDAGAWTVYHGGPAGSGVAQNVSSVDTGTRAWTSPALDGQLYGEPLVDGGRVYVATENDTVYALSASSGAVLWSNHLARPVPASSLPCGDIEPTVGITGTPVVDEARDELFVVADELEQGAPAHVLVGLSTVTGSTELTQPVDPPGSAAAALLQRTGLTLTSGQVVFGFGGNYGDCSTYRGWVVGVPEAGGTPVDFGVDTGAGQSQGAVWMGGAAPAVDGAGNVWVGVGNGSVTSASRPYDHSDSVLELSPALRLVQFFAPSSWATDNARDLDLSMAPALLPDGQVVIAGKAGIAYLLDGSHLGGIGGQRAQLASFCSNDVDGGSAEVGAVVYLPCLSGIVAVRVGTSPPALDLEWSSGTGGGPPIVAGGLVWTIGQDGTLSGLDPTTGSVRQQASVGAPANHFPTPGVGDGLLLAASADRVVAFSASSASASTSPSPTTSAPVHRPVVPGPAGGLPAGEVAGIVIGGVLVIGGGAWMLVRRRKRPPP
jgi:outer membrane protein assembly factor BamB